MAVPDRLDLRRRFVAVPASARLAFYIVAGWLLRLILFTHFPTLLTNDSADYVRAGVEIFWTGNFDSFWLRDVRMPGYPLFLAAIYPLTGVRSDLLVLAQMVLGLLCIPLGWQIGRRLHSQLTADALAIFFALNPVYLLLEHALLSEALALFAMLVFTLLALAAMRSPPSTLLGFGAAVLAGVCALIRVNLLPYCAILLACVAARWLHTIWRRSSGARLARSPAALVPVLLPMLLGLALTLGPWLWRNYAAYGSVALSAHSARSLLVWKTMSGSLDESLPLVRQFAFGHRRLDYDWLHELGRRYPAQAGEAIAAAIIQEQIYTHPGRHWAAVGASALNHAGIYLEDHVPQDDRATVAFWFLMLLANPGAVESSVQGVSQWLDFRPVPQPGPWTALWRSSGMLFLQLGRRLLVLGCVLASAIFGWHVLRGSYPLAEPTVQAVAGLALAYHGTLLFHALTLTGSDRFASLSDWVALPVIIFVVSHQQYPSGIERHAHSLSSPG